MILITLFQEDNIFCTGASLTYGPSLTDVWHIIKEMNRHILFTVCTELMLSVHRADYERTTQLYSSGGGGTNFPGSRPAHDYHTSMLVIECFLTRSMLFLKLICIHIIYTHLFTCTVSETF